MNARVFLLALVTAAFMALWDADRPDETGNAVARSGNFPKIELTAVLWEQSPPTTVLQVGRCPDNVNLLQDAAEESPLIPLPNNLQSGTWHGFNHAGDTVRITVERTGGGQAFAANPQATGLLPEASSEIFCVINGVRWCFIKQRFKIARVSRNLQ